jgi:hypothetical protein
VTGTDGVRGALADALATAGSRQPSSMAGPVADALAELLAEHLRLTTVALGNVLDATDPNSRALAVHHRGVAEKAINRLWEARRELLPDPDAASTPVEKGEHPQVSSDEEQPRAETDTPDAVAYERAWHSGYVAGIEDRGRAEAAAAALGLDGPIVHQVETVTRPPAIEWTPFDPADLAANPRPPAGKRVFVWIPDDRSDRGGTADIAEYGARDIEWVWAGGELATGVTAWAPIPWPAPPGQRLGVSGAEALANWEANAAALKAAGEPTLFGQPVGDGLDDERADAATAISILRLLLRSGARLATLHGAIPGQVVLRPADAVIVTAEQADLLERLDRPVTGPLPHGGMSDAD